jgi:hypothetical protein
MPLPTLNWRLLPPQQLPSTTTPSISIILDLIYAAGTSATYADGTARVPGTGSAWTWGRDTTNTNNPGVTTACFASPPTVTALQQRIIFAGSVNAATPTMNTDTWATGVLLVGANKNSGNYNNANPTVDLGWRSALPFTSGQFSGFQRASLTLATQYAAPTILYMFESQEAVVVMLGGVSGFSMSGAGAMIDPLSASAQNAETDGRLYNLMTSGGTAFVPAAMLSAGNPGSPFFGSVATSNASHFTTFTLGASSTLRLSIGTMFSNLLFGMNYRGGERPLISYPMGLTVGLFLGQLRQMYLSSNGFAVQTLVSGGVTVGYTLGYASAANGELIVLKY